MQLYAKKFKSSVRVQRSILLLYFPDEFKSHFQITRKTCELFTYEVMPTGRIPLGNGSGRAPIPPTKQVLYAFLWSMANQEPTRAVAAKFDITLSSVDWVLKRVSQAAVDLSGRFIRWPNVEFQWLNITTKGQICWVAGVALPYWKVRMLRRRSSAWS